MAKAKLLFLGFFCFLVLSSYAVLALDKCNDGCGAMVHCGGSGQGSPNIIGYTCLPNKGCTGECTYTCQGASYSCGTGKVCTGTTGNAHCVESGTEDVCKANGAGNIGNAYCAATPATPYCCGAKGSGVCKASCSPPAACTIDANCDLLPNTGWGEVYDCGEAGGNTIMRSYSYHKCLSGVCSSSLTTGFSPTKKVCTGHENNMCHDDSECVNRCFNNADNDGDGKLDSADPDCSATPPTCTSGPCADSYCDENPCDGCTNQCSGGGGGGGGGGSGGSSCSCTSWVGGACRIAGCASNERQLTRVCTPSGCDSASKCAPFAGCVEVIASDNCFNFTQFDGQIQELTYRPQFNCDKFLVCQSQTRSGILSRGKIQSNPTKSDKNLR